MNRLPWLLAIVSMLVAPPAASAQGAGGKIFGHPGGYFTIEVPEGWTVEPGGAVFRFRKGDFLLKLVVQEAIADQEEAAQPWINQARAGLGGMERWLDPELDVSLLNARHAVSWSFSGVKDGGKMKFYVLSSSDGKRSYVMVFSAPAEGWDTYGKDWRKFVHGFTMCNAPGSNCSAAARTASSPPAATKAARGSVYSDPQRRFQVQVPAGWRASASDNGAALSRGGAFVNVLVFDGEQPGRNIVAALNGQVGQQWRDFQQLQTGGSTLAGLRADFAVSVGTNPKGIPALLKVIAAPGQGRTFTLMLSAPQAEFESVKADLAQIEQSFSLGGQVSGAAGDQGGLPDAGPLIPSGREPVRSQASAPPRPSPPTPAVRPSPPASTMKAFQGSGFAVYLPSNWKGTRLAEADLHYRISADDGVQVSSNGEWDIMLGMCAGYTKHDTAELRTATDQFVQRVLEGNPGFGLSRAPRQRIAVAGLPAESLLLEGPSRIPGEQEVVWIVTVQRPLGLFHMNLISPRSDFTKFRTLFGQIVASARFN